RLGAVVFIAVNAGVLLLGHRAVPASVTSWIPRRRTSSAGRWIAFAALAAAGVAYRLSAIARTPLDPQQADMLPLIAAPGRKLVAGGNPYDRAHPFQAGVDALDARSAAAPLVAASGPWVAYVPPWLPGLWLPYVPATWAGVDLRLVGLGAALVVAVLLGVAR